MAEVDGYIMFELSLCRYNSMIKAVNVILKMMDSIHILLQAIVGTTYTY